MSRISLLWIMCLQVLPTIACNRDVLNRHDHVDDRRPSSDVEIAPPNPPVDSVVTEPAGSEDSDRQAAGSSPMTAAAISELPIDGDIFVAGYLTKIVPRQVNASVVNGLSNGVGQGIWRNGIWKALATPNGLQYVSLRQTHPLQVNESGWYLLGSFVKKDTNELVPGYWKNGTWVELPKPVGLTEKSTYLGNSMAVDGRDVYVSLRYTLGPDDVEGQQGYWKNEVWTALKTGHSNYRLSGASFGQGQSLLVVGTDVYLSESFAVCSTSTTCSDEGAGYWKNQIWTTLANPGTLSFFAGSIHHAYSGFYILGSSYSAVLGNNFGYWKDGAWNLIDDSSPADPIVWIGSTLLVNGTDVYSGIASNAKGFGYWKNAAWVSIAIPGVTLGATILSGNRLAVKNADVYVVGTIFQAGKWLAGYATGQVWKSLSQSDPTMQAIAQVIAVK